MKRLAFVIAISCCGALGLHAKEHPSASQMLDAALRQSEPFSAASNPFELNSDFTIQGVTPIGGHFVLKWQDQDHWWSRIEVAGFVEIRIRNGELQYTAHNQPATPMRVRNVYSLFSARKNTRQLVLDNEKTLERNGAKVHCMRAHRKEYQGWSEEFCIDPTSHDLLKDTSQILSSPAQTIQFGNYLEFGGGRYPGQLELLINGLKVISATVISMVSAPFDPGLLKPPEGAIERRTCSDMKPPAILMQAQPDYGSSRDHPGVVSQVLINASVLTDGSVSDVNVAERGADFMNEPAIKAVKQYKFSPAMCGSEPVVSDVVIELKYDSGQH